jgi:hypothetical protein
MRGANGRPRPAAFGAPPGSPAKGGPERPGGAPLPAGQEWPSAPESRTDPRLAEPGQWPHDGEWPEAVSWREAGERYRAVEWLAAEQFPPGIWDEPESAQGLDNDSPANPKVAGAPASAGPRSDGRFAAEWSARGVTVRRNSLLHGRRRAGGGAMVREATPDGGLRPVEFAADEFAADWPVPGGTVPGGTVPGGTGPDGTRPGGTGPGVTQPNGPARRSASQWGGAGGRWLVWTLRAVIWAVLLVIGFRGVASIVASVRQYGDLAGQSVSHHARRGIRAAVRERLP